jgi:hypothetical protein
MRRVSFLILLSAAGPLACTGDVTTPASSLTLVALDVQSELAYPVGTTLPHPLRVRVERDGVPQAGVTIRWVTSSGTVSPAESVTDAEGIASSQWSLGERAGTHHAVSSIRGVDRSVYFPVEAIPGPAAALIKEAGDGALLSLARSATLVALEVLVTDQFENPAPLAEVSWSVLDGPVALAGPSQALGDGRHVQHIQVTDDIGAARVQARITGSPIETSFHLLVEAGTIAVALSNLGTYLEVGFRSLQNGSVPAVDTIHPGATVEFRQQDYWDVLQDHTIIPVGLPAIPPCLDLLDYDSTCRITLTIPGTYRYAVASRPTVQGTLVVP